MFSADRAQQMARIRTTIDELWVHSSTGQHDPQQLQTEMLASDQIAGQIDGNIGKDKDVKGR